MSDSGPWGWKANGCHQFLRQTLQLEAAVLEALQARQQRSENGQMLTIQSPAQAIRDVYHNGNGSPWIDSRRASFETMFRAAAMRQPAVDAVVND